MNILVLAGGFSKRMGADKGDLVYYQKAHKYHLYDIFSKAGHNVYISQRSEQEQQSPYKYIIDPDVSIGPMGGIIKAMKFSKAPWFIVGCDYPFFHLEAVTYLINNRRSDAYATCYVDAESGYVIPTCAIYEPKIYGELVNAVANENYGLFKLVSGLDVELVNSLKNWIRGVNSKEEYEAVRKELNI